MKKLVVLIVAMLLATSSLAIVDHSANSMGFYFDLEADMPCVDGVAPETILSMYLLLTNPTFDAVYGFEASYTYEGGVIVMSPLFANSQSMNVGTQDNMIVGFGMPTITSSVTLLVTMDLFYFDAASGPANFYLRGTTPNSLDSDYPVVLIAESELRNVGMSVVAGPTAQINGGCSVVDTENVSLDSIKSLYR